MKTRGTPDSAWFQDPLTGPLAPEIPLPDAPLVRVIAQVTFPPVMSILKPEFIGPFQEAIRGEYTDLSWEDAQTTGVAVGPGGIALEGKGGVWRFQTPGGGWLVSLAPHFVALVATRYSSRTDFLSRLELVLDALAEHIKPRTVQRLGIRYVDRLDHELLPDLGKLVRPEILGVLATSLFGRLGLSITESTFTLEGGQLVARWGLVPPDRTYDPGAIEPRSTPTWVLDLDMFRFEDRLFDSVELLEEARTFSERIYTLFRWAVSEEFLARFGGKP